MNRPLVLTIGIAVLMASPLSALAQAWPATNVSGASGMAPRPGPSSRLMTIERNIIVLRPPGTAPTQPGPARRKALVIRTPNRLADAPRVEVRPKEGWLDDQGLRVTGTRVAFKQRF